MFSHASISLVLVTVWGPLIVETPQVSTVPEEANAGVSMPHISLPSELVAARVREALRDHSDTRAWKQLAEVLPAMALAGGADLGSTLEASRLADSISGASPSITVRESKATARGSIRWMPSWSGIQIEIRPMVMVILALVLVSVLNRIWKTRTVRQAFDKPGRPREPAVNGRSDPWFIKTLAKSGQPVHEIARQTRMAQDAILVLLELQAEDTPQRVTNGGKPATGVGG